MNDQTHNPSEIILLAGRGVYPIEFAMAARSAGIRMIFALGFTRETDTRLAKLVDEMKWVRMGQLQKALDIIGSYGIKHAVMVGQIAPRHLFSLLCMDAKVIKLLRKLKAKNAETIFGALAAELKTCDVTLIPAHSFMDSAMPKPGQLGGRLPTESELADIELGKKVAKTISGLDIGQTVIIKNGTVIAVEDFDGTDKAIIRAGKIAGSGSVVVKAAKFGHDMRFDIPVVGTRTFKMLKKAKASVLAVEAGKTILLERSKLVDLAIKQNVAFTAWEL